MSVSAKALFLGGVLALLPRTGHAITTGDLAAPDVAQDRPAHLDPADIPEGPPQLTQPVADAIQQARAQRRTTQAQHRAHETQVKGALHDWLQAQGEAIGERAAFARDQEQEACLRRMGPRNAFECVQPASSYGTYTSKGQ